MDLELTKEQTMLQQSAAYFIKKEHSFERIRELKKDPDPLGYSKKLWKKMVKLDWMGLIYPEEYGGSELDLGYVMVLLEEFGKGLLTEPWISTVLLGGNLVLQGGNDSQKEDILPAVSSGKLLLTLAYLEDGGRYDINYCATTAEKSSNNFSVSGKKIFVMDGCSADKFIVSARSSGEVADKEGITLFIIDSDAEGLKIIPVKTMDGRNACMLELKNVQVADSDIIGKIDCAYSLLSDVIDQATIGLCAEMVGGMTASLNMTIRHLSDRIQFGKPLGSFQSAQHMAADMFMQKELAASAVLYATASMLENTSDKAQNVSIAKAKCSKAYLNITKTAIQLFGAFGFTNEADIGLFFKRAKVADILFGDVSHHLDRYATLKGY